MLLSEVHLCNDLFFQMEIVLRTTNYSDSFVLFQHAILEKLIGEICHKATRRL